MNCLSRLLAGILIDKLGFKRLMSAFGLLVTINLVSIYFIGKHFIGLLICIWLTWSIWNASCFYMDYFAKKYEASMQRLEALEQELTENQKAADKSG